MKYRGGTNELMRQASRLQRRVEKRREELKAETMEATGGNGQVKVVVNGAQELVSVEIDSELLKSEDLGMVQDLIVATANAALNISREKVDTELNQVTGGMKIPGLM
ncbi:MAG: YbaB/EbfC family nucleoid-associated protein [Deltaproteobacteria bacterium]|nr:YbaB/EbfC family nucleoid-associated protein [Deltaproteobacteria bacterium]